MADVLTTSVAYLTGETDDPNPDCYLVRSDTDPRLFELIEKYRNTDIKTQNRLLAYLHELTSIKEDVGHSEV